MKIHKLFMKKIFVHLLWLSVLVPAASAFEGASDKHVLDNGLTVIVGEMPNNPAVSVFALVKTGSATEGEFLGTGISHFLEHMLFKGTTNREVGEIAAQVQAVGGSINASTGKDHTIYTITVPVESFDVALDVLSDMLMNNTMDALEVEKEREVIFNEMRMHNDNPTRRLSDAMFQNIYLEHPYRHPVIGYRSLLGKVTKEDLAAYYKRYYAPNNAILSIAGGIKSEEILPKIREAFKDFERQRDVLRNLAPEPQQIAQRRYEEEYATDLTRLSLAYSGVSLLDADLFALDVLAKILGQGQSSRLFRDVYKKKKLVYGLSAGNYTPADRGNFEIDAVLEQKNVEAAIAAVLENIDQIKNEGITQEELDTAKRKVLSEHVHAQQTTSGVAYSQAFDEAFTGDYRFSNMYVDAIRQVTAKDIQRVAKQYLRGESLTIVIIKPTSGEDEDESKAKAGAAGEIEKFTLANGLTVLLREDHTFPLVAIRLAHQGGVRQEPPNLNGISKMTNTLWLKGTTSKTAEEIAKLTDALGMRLGSESGRNSFGLYMSFLSEDFTTALDLLEDLVKNPTFPEEEIPLIKDSLKKNITARKDSIFRFTGQHLREELFPKHPFRLDDNGTVESIDLMQREEVIAFYRRLAVPNNMVLAVFGDIDPQATLTEIKRKFEALPRKEVDLKLHSEEPIDEIRTREVSLDKEQAMVMFGFHGTTIFEDDYYGLEVLAAILGSPFSGRLFNNVREQLGQAYTLGGSSRPGIDAGFIYFFVLTRDDNVDQVKKLVKDEIRKLQTVPVSDQELEDMKTHLKGTFKTGLQTNDSLAFTASLDELYGLTFDRYQAYEAQIDRVSQEDIKRLAKRYLDLERMVVVTTRPQKLAGSESKTVFTSP